MSHARIISTEFKSREDLEVATAAWKEWYPDNMPTPLSRYIVRTGEKSTMMTSVYESEDLLNQAQLAAAEWWKRTRAPGTRPNVANRAYSGISTTKSSRVRMR